MHYWGFVFENLTHESENERSARLHRLRRREAARRRRASEAGRDDGAPAGAATKMRAALESTGFGLARHAPTGPEHR